MNYITTCKVYLESVLNFPYRRSAKITNGFILFLVLLSISVVPLHFVTLSSESYKALILLEKIIVTLFSFEYIIRIWVSKKPLHYIFSLRGIIDLISIFPFYISLFIPVENPEIFVALRAFRLFKFDEVFACYNSTQHPNKKDMLHRSISIFPGEQVEHVIQRHPMIFILFSVPPLFFLIIAMLIWFLIPFSWITGLLGFIAFFAAFIYFLKNWIDQNYDIMLITNKRVVFQQRELFGAKSNAVSYSAIHNVLSDNIGFLKWMFKYGDIQIESANRDATLDFKYTPNPTFVVDAITKHVKS